jgi:hypothetical protein
LAPQRYGLALEGMMATSMRLVHEGVAGFEQLTIL